MEDPPSSDEMENDEDEKTHNARSDGHKPDRAVNRILHGGGIKGLPMVGKRHLNLEDYHGKEVEDLFKRRAPWVCLIF